MDSRWCRPARRAGAALLAGAALMLMPPPAGARPIAAGRPTLAVGATWTTIESGRGRPLPLLKADWETRMFWDLRTLAAADGRKVKWTVLEPAAAGLAVEAGQVAADRAVCAATADPVGRTLGCELFRSADSGPGGPRVLWSSLDPGVAASHAAGEGPAAEIGAGTRFAGRERASGQDLRVEGRAVAEGIVLVPAGPQEAVLLREVIRGTGAPRLRYRFLTRQGLAAATLEGPLRESNGAEFAPDRSALLFAVSPMANNGLTIPYTTLKSALTPGRTGVIQYSLAQTAPLVSVDPGWTSVAAMIAPGATNVPYQPDPGDPSSTVILPEVWDFAGVQAGVLDFRTVITLRNDLAGASCLESCAVRDLSAAPADGTWQEWLKIDRFTAAGAYWTRDVFLLNDNDTGADPSIDVPYVAQDELNVGDRTQICFQGSAGGTSRLLRFFKFTGPDPASARMSVGDTWASGAWTSCSDAAGLRLTLASVCGDQCYPGCSSVAPRARGMLGGGTGFADTIVEDGFVHVAAGNYMPALLMRQDTDLQAGRNLFGTCNLGTVRNRSFDYFWLQEHYGYLALVSAPTDTTGTLPPDDWSMLGNQTDRVDVTWGPFPPYQVEARACLAGTLVRWALPADGSHPGTAPGVGDWGYVVSWGAADDPETLADWSANPNHTPLPGEAGYLAAPPGLEPTSAVITGWPGASLNATVVTALRYLDPDIGDLRPYRSAAFFKVVENPARLDPAVFAVGDGVAPFVTRAGDDLQLAWPAVPGAVGYLVRVYDLDTRLEIACPAGLDCAPVAPQTTHAGGAVAAADFGYRVFALDPCGETSAN
jgi:hypothetical protein